MFEMSERDKKAKNVMDLTYLNMLKFMLRTINAWPGRHLGEPQTMMKTCADIILYILQVPTVLCFIPGVLYVISHIQGYPIIESGHNYITVSMQLVYFTRLILTFLKSYKDIIVYFIQKIHLFHSKDKSENARKIYFQVHKMSHYCTVYLIASSIAGMSLFNLTPMFKNISNGMFRTGGNFTPNFDLSINYVLPFDYQTDLRGYIYVTAFNWFISYYCGMGVCMIDLLLFIMAFHVWGHYKILLHKIETFPRPKSVAPKTTTSTNLYIYAEMFSNEELHDGHKRLTECIVYHREITNFVTMMSDVFGPIICFYYLFHLVICCLLLLECSQMSTDALLRYGSLTFIIFQLLIQISVVFELIGTESGKLKDAVYGIPWECMDSRNRLTMLIFLINVMEPMRVKALGIADVGVTTMSGIIKTSFSYFAFLRSVD